MALARQEDGGNSELSCPVTKWLSKLSSCRCIFSRYIWNLKTSVDRLLRNLFEFSTAPVNSLWCSRIFYSHGENKASVPLELDGFLSIKLGIMASSEAVIHQVTLRLKQHVTSVYFNYFSHIPTCRQITPRDR